MGNLCELGHGRQFWHTYHVCLEIGCPGRVFDAAARQYVETLLKDFDHDGRTRGYNIVEFQMLEDHVHMIMEIAPHFDLYTVIMQCGHEIEKQLREKYPTLLYPKQRLWSRLLSTRTMAIAMNKVYLE